jgi:hypothetical protein
MQQIAGAAKTDRQRIVILRLGCRYRKLRDQPSNEA